MSKLATAVFARMQTIYGRQWAAAIGGDQKAYQAALAQWGKSLARYEVDDVGRAIDTAQRHYVDWPPTLPQFVALCRRPACHREMPKALPKPRDKSKAAEAIRELKSIIHK